MELAVLGRETGTYHGAKHSLSGVTQTAACGSPLQGSGS